MSRQLDLAAQACRSSAMSFRFITKSIRTHLIDYPVAVVLIVAGFLLKLGKSSPVALWLSVVTRVSLLLSAFTDHSTVIVGVNRALLQWVDRALGVVSITASSAFNVTGPDAGYWWVFAAAILLTTPALNARGERRPESEPRHADPQAGIGSS